MKWLFIALFLVGHGASALNLKFDSELNAGTFQISKRSFTDNGELNMGYFVTCTGLTKQSCVDMCGAITCLVSIDSCDSCVTSRNLNVFALFRDFSKLFILSEETVNWTSIFEKLKSEDYRIIDENTILNLFDDTQTNERYDDAKSKFLASCPAGTSKAFLVIDRSLTPMAYVCQGTYGQKVFQTKWNPEFSK